MAIASIAVGIAVTVLLAPVAPFALSVIAGGMAAGALGFGLNEALSEKEFCATCIALAALKGAVTPEAEVAPMPGSEATPEPEASPEPEPQPEPQPEPEPAQAPKPTDQPLDWSRTSARTGGDAADHVITNHGKISLTKPQQGVFYSDPVGTTNDAWSIAGKEGITPVSDGYADTYTIPRPNSGYAGGMGGQLGNLDNVTIITEQGTNKIITAFPSEGTPAFPKGLYSIFGNSMRQDSEIGQCVFCHEGLMSIVKNSASGNLLVMCDDCETMWPTPQDALSDTNRIPHNVIKKVGDATLAEVRQAGWEAFLTVSPQWYDAESHND